MRQVLFEWRGVRIYSYPAMLYLGMTFAIVMGNYMANLASMNSARVFIAMILLTIPGLVGARLLFVVAHWTIYREAAWRIWRRSEGGAAMQGGLVLAVLFSVPLLSVMQVPFGPFWDVATPGLLIWLTFARIGCLLHGCCGGRRSDVAFALYLPDHRGIRCRRIPTQLLEGGLAVVLLFGAISIWDQRPFSGALFLSAVAAYGLGRFIIEPMRDAPDPRSAVNLQQALALALMGVSLSGLIVLWSRSSEHTLSTGSVTIDWMALLTPLIVLPVALLFIFVGCAQVLGIHDWKNPNSSDPAPPTAKLILESGCKGLLSIDVTFKWENVALQIVEVSHKFQPVDPNGDDFETPLTGIQDGVNVRCTVLITSEKGKAFPPYVAEGNEDGTKPHPFDKNQGVDDFRLQCFLDGTVELS